jgi:hypothetical protein
MFLDFFYPFLTLDLGWLMLAIARNLWWFFAFFAALHFFEPGKGFFPGFFFMAAFAMAFGTFYEFAGWAFPHFVLILLGWFGMSILVKGTRLERHETMFLCVGITLGAILLV